MLTEDQLQNIKPGEFIEELSTNSLFELISEENYEDLKNKVFRFKTLYSDVYFLQEWNVSMRAIFKYNFVICSSERLQYYRKQMVFK